MDQINQRAILAAGAVLLLLYGLKFNGVEGVGSGSGMAYDFYEPTCPQLESIVSAGLQSISLTDPTSPAALLRLMFHDCQVQGCDASILIDPDSVVTNVPVEITSTRNFAIRKREAVSLIKSMVEAQCPQQVSCSDILILAASEAVAMSGGPRIKVPLGRRDASTIPSFAAADAYLPSPNIGVDGMLRLFASKGMTIEESVAILGGHTLGVTHCFNLQNRLYRGQGEDGIANTEPGFEVELKLSCPLGSPNTSFVLNDPTTLIFDNQYYINALRGRGILSIDAELPLDPRTALFVERFAIDQEYFFQAFASAFVKLSSAGVLTGEQGAIRKSCNMIN